MAKVEPFTRSTIEDCLNGMDLKYMIDQDGDVVLDLGKDDDTGVSYRVFLIAHEDGIYSMIFLGDRDVSKNNWGKAMMACNEWNANRRWPTASLHMDESDGRGQVFLEGHLKLGSGVHAEMFKRFTMSHIAGGISFWEWVTSESKF